jgi:hypothetical protein
MSTLVRNLKSFCWAPIDSGAVAPSGGSVPAQRGRASVGTFILILGRIEKVSLLRVLAR